MSQRLGVAGPPVLAQQEARAAGSRELRRAAEAAVLGVEARSQSSRPRRVSGDGAAAASAGRGRAAELCADRAGERRAPRVATRAGSASYAVGQLAQQRQEADARAAVAVARREVRAAEERLRARA